MRFTSTILLLATAVIVPSPSIAKVSTIRKRSRVYNRVRGRHLNGDGTVVNKHQSNIRIARIGTSIIPDDEDSKIQSVMISRKDMETFAPKSSKASAKGPKSSKAVTKAPTSTKGPKSSKAVTKAPTSSKSSKSSKTTKSPKATKALSVTLGVNGSCDCSPATTQYFIKYIVDVYETQYPGVSLNAISSQCAAFCGGEGSELSPEKLSSLPGDDKLEIKIGGYQEAEFGQENLFEDPDKATVDMSSMLKSDIDNDKLATETQFPITSGYVDVFTSSMFYDAISINLVINGICECSPSTTDYFVQYIAKAYVAQYAGVFVETDDVQCSGSCDVDANSNGVIEEGNGRFLAGGDFVQISMVGHQYVRQGQEYLLVDRDEASATMTQTLSSNIDMLAKETKLPITSGSVEIQSALTLQMSSTLPIAEDEPKSFGIAAGIAIAAGGAALIAMLGFLLSYRRKPTSSEVEDDEVDEVISDNTEDGPTREEKDRAIILMHYDLANGTSTALAGAKVEDYAHSDDEMSQTSFAQENEPDHEQDVDEDDVSYVTNATKEPIFVSPEMLAAVNGVTEEINIRLDDDSCQNDEMSHTSFDQEEEHDEDDVSYAMTAVATVDRHWKQL
uniref:Uncharacterized protein n=1 Tax=Chaetoceros debilis TaxID=122233 RepID=A0A7S3QDJ8_9STRA